MASVWRYGTIFLGLPISIQYLWIVSRLRHRRIHAKNIILSLLSSGFDICKHRKDTYLLSFLIICCMFVTVDIDCSLLKNQTQKAQSLKLLNENSHENALTVIGNVTVNH